MEDNGVSVITICRNSEDLIQETMVSVLNQKYDNFEYIIVDGASTDHTVDLIEQMLKKFTDKGICVDFRSEMDKGIQDAENKGLQRATNKWSILLHAGDTFVDDLVLHRVFTEKDFSNIHGVYGDTVYCWDKYDWVKKPQPFETIFSGLTLPFCTQSVFVRTEVYRKYGFNSEYSPAADYHLFSQLFVEGHQFTYVDIPIVRYMCGGISNAQQGKGVRSKLRTQEVIGGIKHSTFYKWRLIKLTELKMKLKNYLPVIIISTVRKYRIKRWKAANYN